MRQAVSVVVVAGMYAGLVALAVLGTAGMTRAVHRTGMRRRWRTPLLLPATVGAGLVSIVGGWAFYLLAWPFVRLRRTRTASADRRGWQWTAPPEWPAPPPGFVPAPGWSPDPSWPVPAPSHQFWTRTLRGRRQRRVTYAAAALSLLLPAGCVAASAAAGPCVFDPPPGDQLTRTITNDTGAATALLDCEDDGCRRAYSATTVAAGQSTDVIVEGCGTQTMGVADPGTLTVRGCLTEVGDELRQPAIAGGRRMSDRHRCPGPSGPFRARVDSPGR
jgi:hypothetical protein